MTRRMFDTVIVVLGVVIGTIVIYGFFVNPEGVVTSFNSLAHELAKTVMYMLVLLGTLVFLGEVGVRLLLQKSLFDYLTDKDPRLEKIVVVAWILAILVLFVYVNR